jgi:hypothetical protein
MRDPEAWGRLDGTVRKSQSFLTFHQCAFVVAARWLTGAAKRSVDNDMRV